VLNKQSPVFSEKSSVMGGGRAGNVGGGLSS